MACTSVLKHFFYLAMVDMCATVYVAGGVTVHPRGEEGGGMICGRYYSQQ